MISLGHGRQLLPGTDPLPEDHLENLAFGPFRPVLSSIFHSVRIQDLVNLDFGFPGDIDIYTSFDSAWLQHSATSQVVSGLIHLACLQRYGDSYATI